MKTLFAPRRITLAIAFFLLTSVSFAQTIFQKAYSHTAYENGTTTLQTSDGGYLVGGTSGSGQFGPDKIFLVKTDAAGNISWTKNYGGSVSEYLSSIIPTSDGNYVMIGTTYSFNTQPYGNIYMLKIDPSGNLLWSKHYGGSGYDYGYAVQQTSDGGFIIGGLTSTGSAGGYDYYVMKTDSAGTPSWSTSIGGASNDEGYDIVQTSDGGYVIAGNASSFSFQMIPYHSFMLCKLNASGSVLWSKIYSGGGYNLCYAMDQASDGGFVMAGWTDGSGQGLNDVFVVKTDSAGNLDWGKVFGGDSLDIANDIRQTSDGGYIVAGYTKSYGAGNYDAYLLKLDANGDHLWSTVYGGPGSDMAKEIDLHSDGGYVITGRTFSFGAGNSDMYLIKTDASGSTGCNEDDAFTVQTNPNIDDTTVSPIISGVYLGLPVTTTVGTGGTVTSLCSTAGITNRDENENAISIFPNPAGNTIVIGNTGRDIESLDIYNALGQKITALNTIQAAEIKMDISSWTSGVYFIRAVKAGTIVNARFIKEQVR